MQCEQARSFGCETIDLREGGTLRDHIVNILGPKSEGRVDGAVDCVGFEARGMGKEAEGEVPAQVLNDCMSIVREGGKIGIPGLYVTEDPGGVDEAAQFGNLSIRIGLGWSMSHSFTTGQCPVMKYHHQLMQVWPLTHPHRHSGIQVLTCGVGAACRPSCLTRSRSPMR